MPGDLDQLRFLEFAQVAPDLTDGDAELSRQQLLAGKTTAVLAGMADQRGITELGAGRDQARTRSETGGRNEREKACRE